MERCKKKTTNKNRMSPLIMQDSAEEPNQKTPKKKQTNKQTKTAPNQDVCYQRSSHTQRKSEQIFL